MAILGHGIETVGYTVINPTVRYLKDPTLQVGSTRQEIIILPIAEKIHVLICSLYNLLSI